MLLLSGCSGRERHGELVVYTAFPQEEAKYYLARFEEDTGIRVRWVRLSAGIVLARLEAEKRKPSADVWFGGPSDTFVQATDRGLLMACTSKEGADLPASFRDEEGRWFGIYFGVIAFASNRPLLEEHGLDPPRSWHNLLDPAWKGLVQMAYPYSSGTAYTICASLLQLMGEKAGFDYMKELDRNILQYTSSGTAPIDHTGFGETGVCIAFSHDIMRKRKTGNYPLVMTFPKEGTGYEVGGVAIIEGAPHVEEARTFLEWALSDRLQRLYSECDSFRIPVLPGISNGTTMEMIKDVPLIEYDNRWAGKNRQRIIAEWKEKILR
jgi:iron(III) transport system substrate-binding protein